MTRFLLLTCKRRGCKSEGRVEIHGTQLLTLPTHWRLVSTSYDGHGLEFCSLDCVTQWAAATEEDYRQQREREAQRLAKGAPVAEPAVPADQQQADARRALEMLA